MSGLTSLVQAGGVLEKKIETVANNLANASTVGFKEDQPSFRDYFPLYKGWFLNQTKKTSSPMSISTSMWAWINLP